MTMNLEERATTETGQAGHRGGNGTAVAPREHAASQHLVDILVQVTKRNGFAAAVLIVALVGLDLWVPAFLSGSNILTILQQVAILGVVTIGMVFVVLTAGIDLSVGSNLALTSVGFALMASHGVAPWLAVVFAILIGGVFGLINGVGIALLRLQPFVMTLATLATGSGVALTIANGSEVQYSRTDALVNFLGNGGIGLLSGEFVVFAGVVAVAWFITKFVPFGRRVYAVGGSEETARLSGVRVKRVVVAVYVIAGLCAGLAGVMTAAQLSAGEPTAGSTTNLQAIAAVVIGGVSLFGGRGGVIGGAIGAFVLAIIANVLILLGVSPYSSETVQGIVIIVAVLIASREARDWVREHYRRAFVRVEQP
jgi:ribose transport system permease protein